MTQVPQYRHFKLDDTNMEFICMNVPTVHVCPSDQEWLILWPIQNQFLETRESSYKGYQEHCLYWYVDQKTIYSLLLMAGRQLAQIGAHLLQTAVYKYYRFKIPADTATLLVHDFTFFKGNYKILPSNSLILFWMELMMLSLTKGAHIAKLLPAGCLC